MPSPVLRLLASALLLASTLPGVPGPSLALATGGPRPLDPTIQRFNPRIDAAPHKQINDLIGQGRRHDAELLRKMAEQPHAGWFTEGTPKEAQYKVGQTMQAARAKGQVPTAASAPPAPPSIPHGS
jgi:hypothetical protein